MNGGYGAQQALEAQTNTSLSDPVEIAQRISNIHTLLPRVKQNLEANGYPRHEYASFRAGQLWYGNPPQLVYAWKREIGIGFTDYGYTKVPTRSVGVAILIDVSNAIRIISTLDAANIAYGECELEELTPPQLRALEIICEQLSGPPKFPSWKITPMAGHAD